MASQGQDAVAKAWRRVTDAARQGFATGSATGGEAYSAALDWKHNSELSHWLMKHLSHQSPTPGSKAMDAEFLRTHIAGGWHRLYDGGHTIAGSWKAVSEALPDHLSLLDKIGTWANEYWKDLITVNGMPIVLLDHAHKVDEYLKHLDCVNVAELIGGPLSGVSIYCNWDDPTKLMASAGSSDFSGFYYANIVSPLVNLVAIARAYWLLKRSEQDDLRDLIAPALRGLTRGGATVLFVTVVPGGFLLHLSSGIVISLAHGYAWDKMTENKEAIFAALKQCVAGLSGATAPVSQSP